MKKIYLMATLFGAASLSFGQLAQQPLKTQKLGVLQANSGIAPVYNKADVVWSNTFDADANDWSFGLVLDSEDEDEIIDMQNYNWQINTPDNMTVLTDDASQEWDFADFFGIWDGSQSILETPLDGVAYIDPFQFAERFPSTPEDLDQHAYIQLNGTIDLAAYEEVAVRILQSHIRWNRDRTFLDVSLDAGATWTTYEMNLNEPKHDWASVEQRVVVNVANSSTVKLRFRYTKEGMADFEQEGQTGFFGGYGWFIDDLEIQELPEHDMATDGRAFLTTELYYTYQQVPLVQTSGYNFYVPVANLGGETETNVTLAVEETTGTGYSKVSTGKTINVGKKDTLWVTDPFIATQTGSYQFELAMDQDDEDGVPGNNGVNDISFRVTNDLFAKDAAGDDAMDLTKNFGEYSIPGGKFEGGNVFKITDASQGVVAIEFRTGGTLANNGIIEATIFKLTDPDNILSFEDDGDAYINYADEAHGDFDFFFFNSTHAKQYLSIEVSDEPLYLTPGYYYFGVGTDATAFSLAAEGPELERKNSLLLDEQYIYTIDSSPIVRVRMEDGSLATSKNEMTAVVSSNYPNPFTNETTVSYTLNESVNVSYTIVDLAGNVVATGNEGKTAAGNHNIVVDGSSFASGVYFFNLQAGDNTVTHKMIVNK